MEYTHAGRADELAGEANRMLQEALAATADLAGETGLANYIGTGGEVAERLMWERLRTIQAQAQIHATLAVADELTRNRMA